MFIGDKIMFLELQKTGSTLVQHVLSSLDFVTGRLVGKHNIIENTPEAQNVDGHVLKVGSIRNPWDWYVSLWAFGCTGQGSVYVKTTQNKRRPPGRENGADWMACYLDADDPNQFRTWLKRMFHRKTRGDFGEDFAGHPMSGITGLLTYRYLRLFTIPTSVNIPGLNNKKRIQYHDFNHNFVDHMIRFEHLLADLITMLRKAGYRIDKQQMTQLTDLVSDKINASSHRHYTDYYDRKTRKLVAKHEWLIIRKYGYTF